jgi:hypothetical protein
MILISIIIKPNSAEGQTPTTVHMKDKDSGPVRGLLPFENDILNGFADKR